mgnify:FL=1
MNRRVNIQYSVKIDDLNNEVSRLLKDAHLRLNKLCENESLIADKNILSLEAHQLIDNLRLGLSDIDASLSEVNSIITSYLDYKTRELMETPQSPEAPPPGAFSQADLMNGMPDLQEKLAKFKNSLDIAERANENTD